MRKHQKCIAEKRTFSIVVPSSSNNDIEYTITGSFEMGQLHCSCPGFKFSGTCKHTRFDIEECGWNSAESVEVQSLDQKDRHECPRCGRRTVDVFHGDF